LTEQKQVESQELKIWPKYVVWVGFFVSFLGFVSYLVHFSQIPSLRDVPLVNLPLVIIGFLLAAFGCWHVFQQKSGKLGKIFAVTGTLLSLFVTVMFHWYIFVFSYRLPKSEQAPKKQAIAPDFSLKDHTGKTRKLSEYRGKKVLLVFYRGFW